MKSSRKIVINPPDFAEEDILQFLQAQGEKGELVRLKYLHLLLPKAITYLQRIRYLDRKDERYHANLLKTRFKEISEALIQSKLIALQGKSKLKYLDVTDLGKNYLRNPDSTIKNLLRSHASKNLQTPAQTTTKSLKDKDYARIIAIPSALLLFIPYSVLFATFFEVNYSLPASFLLVHYPWLAFYVFGFSAFFTLISAYIIRQIIKAYDKKHHK